MALDDNKAPIGAEDAKNNAMADLAMVLIDNLGIMSVFKLDPEFEKKIKSADVQGVVEKLSPLRNLIVESLPDSVVNDDLLQHLARHLISIYDTTKTVVVDKKAEDVTVVGIVNIIHSLFENVPVIARFFKDRKKK